MNVLFRSLATVWFLFVVPVAWTLETAPPEKKPFPLESGREQKSPAPAAAPTRGELLYENHCTGCHESKLHIQVRRRAKSVTEIEGWVRRWSSELKLGWGDDEVQAVSRFLARRYYRFDVPSERN